MRLVSISAVLLAASCRSLDHNKHNSSFRFSHGTIAVVDYFTISGTSLATLKILDHAVADLKTFSESLTDNFVKD
ncbi:hypothetical protein J6590_090900, partial [Homalodisca vitripennis]